MIQNPLTQGARGAPAQRSAQGKHAVRVQRFGLAAITYVICAPLLAIAHAIGLVSLASALFTLGCMLAANLVFLAMFRGGFNERFRDPSLTLAQSFVALAIVLYNVYSFNSDRGLPLLMLLIVLLFGVFRFTTREFVSLVLCVIAGHALVINLLMWFKPDTVNVLVEWFQWLAIAAMLPCFALVGGRISEMRQRLRRTNEELASALGTIQQLATHDTLTGLPNRALFNETLQHALAQAERHGRKVALFFMDLDRFKNINDTLGHQFGDRALKQAGERLARCIRESDVMARLGGDEFVLLVEEFGPSEDLAEIANKLLYAMSHPLIVDRQEFNLTVSIGICTYPNDGADAQALLSNADIAMYRAKEQGRNSYCFYSAHLNHHTHEKLALEASLAHALDREEFRVHYQPKIDIATGALTGVEALLRWEHPERGLLAPDEFIPLAEETGLIVPIGLWVLRTVCARAKAWQAAGLPRLPVAVNLSAMQFREAELVSSLAHILKSTGLAADTLELEITESMVMKNPEEAVELMHVLRNMGVRLAIDDFGTGYSSLGYLKRFPINSLKVDRTFVRDLPHNHDDIAITRAVIAMAHSLNMNVIAEGVEHQAQFDLLRDEGCDEFQGFFCRPPMAEDDLMAFIRGGRSNYVPGNFAFAD